MNSDFSGRSSIVTGAASGIGNAIARALWSRGSTVTLVDLPGERLERASEQLPGTTIRPVDLAQRADVRNLAAELGSVDILVNNAGLQHVSAVEDFAEERWDQMLAVMLSAPFFLMRGALPGMYARDWGRIINVASVHGLVASPYKSAYVAAKHGLLGLTKTIALEAGARKRNVTVHAVAPSYVRTPLVERQVTDQARLHGIEESEVLEHVLLAQNAIKRLIEPEEVAEAVLYLCGDSAWATSGNVLTLDAGWLAH